MLTFIVTATVFYGAGVVTADMVKPLVAKCPFLNKLLPKD